MSSTVWFTSDEHYGHKNIIEYASRPFASVEEMDDELIHRHNAVVGPEDTVYHIGDFCLRRSFEKAMYYMDRLNGKTHIIIPGSHDAWLREMHGVGGWPLPFYKHRDGTNVELSEAKKAFCIVEPALITVQVGSADITMCHYCMRTWPKSHYNTWHLFGHSHGRLEPIGKSWDVGVDNNDFTPVSLEQLKTIMAKRPDNPNRVKNRRWS